MVMYNVIKITKNKVVSCEKIELTENNGKVDIFTLNENNQDFDIIKPYLVDDVYYCVFGNVTNDTPGNENVYELPPPYDRILFFNDLYIVKCKSFKKQTCRRIENLSVKHWNDIYEKLFGGFESLGEDDDEIDSYEEEEINIDPRQLTKSGYLKNDFVVSDNEEEYEEGEGEDDDEDYEEEEEEDYGDEEDDDYEEDDEEDDDEDEDDDDDTDVM